jgi:hypothetical protein
MSGMSVLILRDTASAMVRNLGRALDVEGLRIVIGRAEQRLFRDHLYALNSTRHRYGRGYYRQAADSVTFQANPRLAIGISQIGMRLRLEGTDGLPGGRLRPRPGKRFLTIPAAPEAQGKLAGEFDNLKVRMAINPKTGRLQRALVRGASSALRLSRRKAKDGSIKWTVKPGEVRPVVMFFLAASVYQKPDRSVLPSDEQIVDTALTTVDRRLARLGGESSAPQS